MSEPDEDTFYDLKKDEFILLARDLQLEARKAVRKYHIRILFLSNE